MGAEKNITQACSECWLYRDSECKWPEQQMKIESDKSITQEDKTARLAVIRNELKEQGCPNIASASSRN